MAALAVAVWFRGFYAMFKAAANRKPGVSFWSAMNGLNLLFRNEPYTDLGVEWSKTYIRCMFGFLLFGSLAAVLGIAGGHLR